MTRTLFALAILAASLSAGTYDLEKSLAKWKPVPMPFHADGLSAREKKLVATLAQASLKLDHIYWLQSDPAGLALYHSTRDARLRRMLVINGSRFDLLGDNHNFASAEAYEPQRGLYPSGVTREQIEAYVRAHPDQKAKIYDSSSVLRKNGDALEAVPYHVAYAKDLSAAALLLRKAAALSDDQAFANFLRLRADALLSDDYYPSDVAWVDLHNPKFDIIFAPYETYLDDVLAVRGSYGAAVLVRNEAESAKLALYEKYVPAIQDALPLDKADLPSKEGQPSPMEVMDAPYRAGDLRHGYQAVADNLPNDPRIHAEKGTKKIFFKNFMDARVSNVILPLAKQVMREDQAAKATGEGYLAAVVMHEICHGLGPAYSRMSDGKKGINEALGPAYAALEESKADVTGMFGLGYLLEHGALPKERAEEFYDSYVAGIFRSVRYGVAEAHGRAEMMEFNYLSERGAITFEGGRYVVNTTGIAAALKDLAHELLVIEATGDRARAEAWFNKYDKMPDTLASALAKVQGVPVDVDPKFDFPDF